MAREGKMLVKDEAKISSRVGGVVYFGKLVFESDEQEFFFLVSYTANTSRELSRLVVASLVESPVTNGYNHFG